MKVYVVIEHNSSDESTFVKSVNRSFKSAREVVEKTYKKWLVEDADVIWDEYSVFEVLADSAYAKVESEYWYATIETVLMEVED